MIKTQTFRWFTRLGLPALSAFMLYLAFPPFSWWGFSFVALLPLFATFTLHKSLGARLFSGFILGVVFSGLMGHWIYDTLVLHYRFAPVFSLLFVILAVCLPIGLLYSLPGAGLSVLSGQFGFVAIFTFASLWILTEYLKELIPMLLPWATIGYALLPWQRFVQIADITGIYGISLIVLLINGCLFVFCLRIIQFGQQSEQVGKVRSGLIRPVMIPLFSLGLLIALPLIYGSVSLNRFPHQSEKNDRGHSATAILVQGNFDLKDRWSGMGFNQRLATYLEMSDTEDHTKIQIIVWPETVLNSTERLNSSLFASLVDQIGVNSTLVAGGLRKNEETGGVFNTAYLISGKGSIRWYDKKILLPYAEISPGNSLLGSYYQAPNKFERGNLNPAIRTDAGTLGLSICFEILYPNYIRQSVKQGARVLINISNDAWFPGHAMPALHLQSAVMRAIENRRYVLRVSNSGYSAVISPSGTLIHRSELSQRITLESDFSLLSTTSIYTALGDWVLLAALVFLGITFIRTAVYRQ